MKTRLDILVANRAGVSRSKAQAMIMAGQVSIEGKIHDKSGSEVDASKQIEIKELFPYVSRGALKLEKAAEDFEIDFKNKVVCDVGSSTGGFTDYALQHGAKKVYAIDVGTGQLAQKIREDERVIVMERTDIRSIASLPAAIDVFVIDVSFVSLKKILPQVARIAQGSRPKAQSNQIIALVKPQFEVGKKVADKYKGVIKDETIQQEVLDDIQKFAKELGYTIEGTTTSPIKGAKGNTEFLLYLTHE